MKMSIGQHLGAFEVSTVLGIGGSTPRLLQDGTLLLVRDGQLIAAPFDIDRLSASVRPVTALEGMLVEGWIGQFAVSQRGTIAYVPGKWLLGNELVWDDGQGNVEPLGFPSLAHGDFELYESGRYEIYVRAVGGDRSYPVSLDGGEEPIFSDDGKTLYFRNGNRFHATPILGASADGTRFRAGQPRVVVEGAYSNVPGISYDVGPDGRLLLLRTDGGTERPSHLNVILNWSVNPVVQP